MLLQLNCAPIWLQSFQNQLSTAILHLQQISKSVLLETSPVVWVHMSAKQCHASILRTMLLVQVNLAPMWIQLFQNLVLAAVLPLQQILSEYCYSQVSSWGTLCLPSTVMHRNWNKAITTAESCSNVGSIIPKSSVSSSHILALDFEVSTPVGDKSSSWGMSWSIDNKNFPNPNNRTSHSFLHQVSHQCILMKYRDSKGSYLWGKWKVLRVLCPEQMNFRDTVMD